METGEIARQASGAVLVNIDEPWCWPPWWRPSSAEPGPGLLPADGRLHREDLRRRQDPGRLLQARRPSPTEQETLTSRLIDRPIRPLFPEGFFNEVQVVIRTVCR